MTEYISDTFTRTEGEERSAAWGSASRIDWPAADRTPWVQLGDGPRIEWDQATLTLQFRFEPGHPARLDGINLEVTQDGQLLISGPAFGYP